MKSDSKTACTYATEQLARFVCPRCRGKLTHDSSNGSLECSTCHIRYRITSGIPILLQDHAEPCE